MNISYLPLQGKGILRTSQGAVTGGVWASANCSMCCSMSSRCPGCNCSAVRRGN